MDQQSRLVVRSGTFPTCFTGIRRNNATRGTVTLVVCCATPGLKRSSPISVQQHKPNVENKLFVIVLVAISPPHFLWNEVVHRTGRVGNVPCDHAKIQTCCEHKYAGNGVYKMPSETYWRNWLARRPALHAPVRFL
jgi:hypothetical protein